MKCFLANIVLHRFLEDMISNATKEDTLEKLRTCVRDAAPSLLVQMVVDGTGSCNQTASSAISSLVAVVVGAVRAVRGLALAVLLACEDARHRPIAAHRRRDQNRSVLGRKRDGTKALVAWVGV